jgi:hypothetical protein
MLLQLKLDLGRNLKLIPKLLDIGVEANQAVPNFEQVSKDGAGCAPVIPAEPHQGAQLVQEPAEGDSKQC